jgi:hypothetical protein
VSEFCRKHSSHYCPCVAPQLYATDSEAARQWDLPPEQRTAKRRSKRG